MFSLLKLASFALVASSGASSTGHDTELSHGLSEVDLNAQDGPSSALRGGSSSPNYQLMCTQPNAPAPCMFGKKSKNALIGCCADFAPKTVGYTCADGTVFCCTDPQGKQWTDGSPTDIAEYKGCLKAVPDFEEAMTA